jgi:hypothetical protein
MEEITLTIPQMHEFIKWVLKTHEMYMNRWQLINDPDKGNWTTGHMYDLYIKQKKLTAGDKVVYEGKVYDYGYLGQTGKAIIYEEGCHNMQDSKAVEFNQLTRPL